MSLYYPSADSTASLFVSGTRAHPASRHSGGLSQQYHPLTKYNMYRKRNGSLGFSFTRFAHAAVPNFFEDPSPIRTVSLTSYRYDMCYMHQIASPNPYALDDRSFYVAGVCDGENVSKKVYNALIKHGILKIEDGTVDTYKIGPQFTHQFALLNINRQKDLVVMLLWW